MAKRKTITCAYQIIIVRRVMNFKLKMIDLLRKGKGAISEERRSKSLPCRQGLVLLDWPWQVRTSYVQTRTFHRRSGAFGDNIAVDGAEDENIVVDRAEMQNIAVDRAEDEKYCRGSRRNEKYCCESRRRWKILWWIAQNMKHIAVDRMLCYAMLYYAMLCYAMLCCVILLYVMLFYVISFDVT